MKTARDLINEYRQNRAQQEAERNRAQEIHSNQKNFTQECLNRFGPESDLEQGSDLLGEYNRIKTKGGPDESLEMFDFVHTKLKTKTSVETKNFVKAHDYFKCANPTHPLSKIDIDLDKLFAGKKIEYSVEWYYETKPWDEWPPNVRHHFVEIWYNNHPRDIKTLYRLLHNDEYGSEYWHINNLMSYIDNINFLPNPDDPIFKDTPNQISYYYNGLVPQTGAYIAWFNQHGKATLPSVTYLDNLAQINLRNVTQWFKTSFKDFKDASDNFFKPVTSPWFITPLAIGLVAIGFITYEIKN